MRTTPPLPLSWTATMPLTQGARSMSSTEQTAYAVVSAAGYVGSNILAWASSFDAGAFATGFTLVSLVGIGAYSKLAKAKAEIKAEENRLEAARKAEETRLEADRIREVEKAKSEAWADRVRLETQVRIDQEKLEANSLNGQIKVLTAKIDASNVLAVELQQRIEDANKKLHEAANERQNEVYRHHAESQTLMAQVSELREENRRLMAQIAAKVQANTVAVDRIVSPDAGTSLDMETRS